MVWWMVRLVRCPASYYISYVRAPWTWGLFLCFCVLFCLLNIEKVYNKHPLYLIFNFLASNVPKELSLFWEGLHGPPPLYHYSFGARPTFLRLRRRCLQVRSGHALYTALAIYTHSVRIAIRTF